MPKFKYKPQEPFALAGEEAKPRPPTAHIPVSPKQVRAVEVDTEVEILLRGKLVGASTNEGETFGPDGELTLELIESDVYPVGNEFTELAEDEDED